jgi:hypothetical protein
LGIGGSVRFVISILISLLFAKTTRAETRSSNLIAVGQGISSPTSTSTLHFSSGYTYENPVGTIYQNGFRLTAQYDKGTNATTGAELGYGQGKWGAAAGYQKNDCDSCEATSAFAIGLNLSDVGVGFRFTDDIYAIGIIFNSQGQHRFGLMAQLDETGGTGSNITEYGLGYSYVNSQVTLSLDASTRSYENSSIKDDRVIFTPGVMLRADMFQLSVNNRMVLNKSSSQTDKDSTLWFGIGIGGDKWHLVYYSDYVNENAIAASLFF